MVTGIQIAIAVLGEFRGDRLQQYVGCLEASLRAIMTPDNDVNATPPTFSLPDNFTYPVSGLEVALSPGPPTSFNVSQESALC